MFKTSYRKKGVKELKSVVTVATDDLETFAKTYFTAEEVDQFLWYGMSVQFFQDLRGGSDEDVTVKLRTRFGADVSITHNVPVETQDEMVKALKGASPALKAQIAELLKASGK